MTYDYDNEPDYQEIYNEMDRSDDLRDMENENIINNWKPIRIDPKREREIFDRWFGIGKKEGRK